MNLVSKAVWFAWSAAVLFLGLSDVAAQNRPRGRLLSHPGSQGWGADNRAQWSRFDRVAAEREDEQVRGAPGIPMRLGVNRATPQGAIDLQKARRSRHASGRFVWTYQLNDPGAAALRAHLSRFDLPPGGELAVAGADGEAEVYRGRLEPFWTPPVAGDTVYLEYRSPVGDRRPPRIEVDQISHIYVDPMAVNGINGTPTLPCQVDVNCYNVPPGVRDAVGRLVYTSQAGTFMCTGTLLADADPNTSAGYLLTANHCINTAASASSLAVYWFYQTEACNGTVPALTSVPRSDGSTLLVTSTETDVTLVRLHDDPREGQGFVQSTTNTPSSQLVAIHHPRGEHKRVSVGQLTSSPPFCGTYPTNRFLYLDWSMGITEASSSGAPLFDSNWQLVGQLFGTCSYSNATCTNPEAYNAMFGRFSVSYSLLASHLQTVVPDDAYENNDTLQQAQPIAMGTNALRLVDLDDYFSVTLPRSARINLTAMFSTLNLDLDLALLAANGSVLLSSAGAIGTETINSAVLPGGAYVIRASKTHHWGGDYTLVMALVPDSNATPVAATDHVERVLTNGVKFLASTLLANDVDANSDPIRLLSIDSFSANGATVTRQGDWVHYTPVAGFTNQDSFTYRIADFFNAVATGLVVVTNNISAVPPPGNALIRDLGNGSFLIRFNGVPGKTYGIECSDSLSPPDWHRLGSAVANSVGRIRFTNTPPNGLPHRFYRAAYP